MRFPAQFPWRFGGHDNTQDIELQTMLDALSPGWDVSEGTEAHAEISVDALAVTMIWTVNRRIGKQRFPLSMMDDLEAWEEATRMRVTPSQSLKERRRRLAARLRGIANNAFQDIDGAARTALGHNFVATVGTADGEETSYMPGINPGPPGYEFSNTTAHICIHTNQDGISDQEWRDKRDSLIETLGNIVPVWLQYTIGVGDGTGSFIADIGIADITILG